VITDSTFKAAIPPDAHKILFTAQLAAARQQTQGAKQQGEGK
jgi:hypothetical protein